jgi:hypothetical protein
LLRVTRDSSRQVERWPDLLDPPDGKRAGRLAQVGGSLYGRQLDPGLGGALNGYAEVQVIDEFLSA